MHDGNLIDLASIIRTLKVTQPTEIYVHLSALSAPAGAQSDPRTARSVNTWGPIPSRAGSSARARVPAVVRQHRAGLWQRGRFDAPFTEASPLAPAGEYAVTKAATDLLLGALAPEGLRSIRGRLFNHTDAGQSALFVVQWFAA